MKYLIALTILCMATETFAQEWIYYQQYQQPIIQQTITYPVVPLPPQPAIIYQWVPYSAQQNIIVEQHCLFRRTQTLISRPTVQWVYQPVVIYR